MPFLVIKQLLFTDLSDAVLLLSFAKMSATVVSSCAMGKRREIHAIKAAMIAASH